MDNEKNKEDRKKAVLPKASQNGKAKGTDEDVVQVQAMRPGEVELRKIFEETTIHNVTLCVNHSNQTRALLRDFQKEVQNLKNIVVNRDRQIEQMQKQIAMLLQDKFKSGT